MRRIQHVHSCNQFYRFRAYPPLTLRSAHYLSCPFILGQIGHAPIIGPKQFGGAFVNLPHYYSNSIIQTELRKPESMPSVQIWMWGPPSTQLQEVLNLEEPMSSYQYISNDLSIDLNQYLKCDLLDRKFYKKM